MLRLDQLYFRSFFTLFFTTLLMVAIAGYYLLEKIEINNHKTMLVNMIDQFVLFDALHHQPEEMIAKIRENSSVRVTVIDEKGKVLYESNRKISGMSNHLHRPEIQQAQKEGTGSSIRYSDSVGRDFLYVAKHLDNHYIRMAYALNSIKDKFFRFWFKAMGLFSFSMLVAFWIAMKINRQITRDLEYIKISLENLLNKRYNMEMDEVRCCREFEVISKQIKQVAKKLEKRDRQKAKYTKNLKILSKKQSDVISAISHEFKNPVAAIMGYTQSVREDADIDSAIKDKFLDKVLKNAHKISLMIDRLAMTIKLENESFSPEFITFKLRPLVEDVAENLKHKYKERKIIIDIPKDLTLKADRTMFDNLLTNLIENGLKYSEDEVLVQTKEGRVEIIDSGIGIQKEDIDNITKRFFRVDSLTWDNSIGVGLYIVKYILKLHGSYLEIESTPNVGSKFWFDVKMLTVPEKNRS